MKKFMFISLTALSLAGFAYAACGSCPKDKKADEKACTSCDKKESKGGGCSAKKEGSCDKDGGSCDKDGGSCNGKEKSSCGKDKGSCKG